jgi:isocitrate/isopropylmalate dehydrogenase
MMLDWLGETDKAQVLEKAVAEVIREGRVGTYDVGLSNTNIEVAQEIVNKL